MDITAAHEYSWMIDSGRLRTYKEMAMTCFEVLTQHFLGQTERNYVRFKVTTF
jgi:hypothetical protein